MRKKKVVFKFDGKGEATVDELLKQAGLTRKDMVSVKVGSREILIPKAPEGWRSPKP